MGDLISLTGAKAYMVKRLAELVEEAKRGDIIAMSYVPISIGHLKVGKCGVHELVGATRMLSDITAASAAEDDFEE